MSDDIKSFLQAAAAAVSERLDSRALVALLIIVFGALLALLVVLVSSDEPTSARSGRRETVRVVPNVAPQPRSRQVPSGRVRVLSTHEGRTVTVRAAPLSGRLCRFCGLRLEDGDHRDCQEGYIDD